MKPVASTREGIRTITLDVEPDEHIEDLSENFFTKKGIIRDRISQNMQNTIFAGKQQENCSADFRKRNPQGINPPSRPPNDILSVTLKQIPKEWTITLDAEHPNTSTSQNP